MFLKCIFHDEKYFKHKPSKPCNIILYCSQKVQLYITILYELRRIEVKCTYACTCVLDFD